MEINMTLVVQMIVFAIFVWFTMRFVWPPLEKAMEERRDKIAEGLSAAERGRREFELAQHRARDEMKQAKVQANDIVEKANKRAAQIMEEAREGAKLEVQRQNKIAQEQLQQEVQKARDKLKNQLAALVVSGASRILQKEVSAEANSDLLNNLIEEM